VAVVQPPELMQSETLSLVLSDSRSTTGAVRNTITMTVPASSIQIQKSRANVSESNGLMAGVIIGTALAVGAAGGVWHSTVRGPQEGRGNRSRLARHWQQPKPVASRRIRRLRWASNPSLRVCLSPASPPRLSLGHSPRHRLCTMHHAMKSATWASVPWDGTEGGLMSLDLTVAVDGSELECNCRLLLGSSDSPQVAPSAPRLPDSQLLLWPELARPRRPRRSLQRAGHWPLDQ
jgi:hypothetical protein